MVKARISATVDEDIEKMLDELLKDDNYRNKSHVIEKAIKLFWEEKHGKKRK